LNIVGTFAPSSLRKLNRESSLAHEPVQDESET